MTQRTTAERLRAEIPISAEWRTIDLLRRTVIPYISAVFDDEELCSRASIITAELVENAVKYGHWQGGDPSDFKLAVRGSETHLRVEVTNPVDDGTRSIRELVALVEWINRFPSAKDAYLTRLVEVANKKFATGQSGLGLVRLAYEAGCQLEVDLLPGGDVVSITGVIERAVEQAQATKDLERLATIDIPDLDVEISCSEDPDQPVRLTWRGRACHERPATELAPLVETMVARASPADRPVELHVEDLEDMSSTSAAVLMKAANDLLSQGRKIIIVYDSDRRWQRMTFEGLSRSMAHQGSLEFRAA